MSQEYIFGCLAIACSVAAYVPYVLGMVKGRVKPHVFSWMVWALIAAIVFVAQYGDNAGAGAWVTGFNAGMYILIGAIAYWQAKEQAFANITRSDWLAFLAGLATIPLWLVTKNPLYSVLFACVIDVAGFYPTYRKSFSKPYEEALGLYALTTVEYALSLAALAHWSAVTMALPIVQVAANGIFVAMVMLRRMSVNPS